MCSLYQFYFGQPQQKIKIFKAYIIIQIKDFIDSGHQSTKIGENCTSTI